MKKIISVLALTMLLGVAAFAQKKDEKKDDAWREKMRAEQVAFITQELNLTEAEAQQFWPVYNDIQAKRRKVYTESFEAMKALREAVEKDADVKVPMEKYLSAKKKLEPIDEEAVQRYSKVLTKAKVAKLILSEERFRHNQIGKLGQGGPQGGFKGGHQGAPQGPGMGAPDANASGKPSGNRHQRNQRNQQNNAAASEE